ncbi:MAG: sigma-70 family RNA polymerase sigma factor [Candidatus Omnitrophica bacterium]|nr:sigma-70 family RNA polymerase sigma factor [Candidatus Omnitrophota bacterium]
MEYLELIKKLKSKLEHMVKGLKNGGDGFDIDDCLQEIYLYLWIEWNNGNIKGKNESYILKGCYYHLKNFLRKNKSLKFISLEEMMENNSLFDVPNNSQNSYLIDFEKMYNILNEREKKVVNFIMAGYTIREIGKNLGISHVMVLKIIKKIRSKISNLKIEI